jgi:hypothetical protein
MKKPSVRIHNTETDEIIDREMTDDEFAAYKADIELVKSQNIVEEKAKSDKMALLERLGITADEAALLLQ